MHISLCLCNTRIKYLCTQIQCTIHSKTLLESRCPYPIPHRLMKVNILSSFSPRMCHIHWRFVFVFFHFASTLGFQWVIIKRSYISNLVHCSSIPVHLFSYAACSRAGAAGRVFTVTFTSLWLLFILLPQFNSPPLGSLKFHLNPAVHKEMRCLR